MLTKEEIRVLTEGNIRMLELENKIKKLQEESDFLYIFTIVEFIILTMYIGYKGF